MVTAQQTTREEKGEEEGESRKKEWKGAERERVGGGEERQNSREELKLNSEQFGSRSKMCSLNRSMSLSMFPREPAAGLDATVDYVKNIKKAAAASTIRTAEKTQ
ncbi:hypothetical protein F7725_028004 [Dissostichus mawsoni]|uniref:Uncharacterized protein n=1 Tax=Dissostichus mawsoni TaxID=36200 RepID=A0A7J5XEH2_DISMA|nr:hypothetical protein F7725_028004 [Dissostichus mawsoni]